jgi:hypothetical protein
MRGIFCVDPGETTGVAWGIVDEKTSLRAITAVKERQEAGSTTLKGDEASQIRNLYRLWTAFKRDCVRRFLEPAWIDLVVEDFTLYPGERPGKATTSPERIAWGFEGYRMAMYDRYRPQLARDEVAHFSPTRWQKSGAAHRFTTQEILKEADAWIRGREHERSAFAHMILRTNILMDGHRPGHKAR